MEKLGQRLYPCFDEISQSRQLLLEHKKTIKLEGFYDA